LVKFLGSVTHFRYRLVGCGQCDGSRYTVQRPRNETILVFIRQPSIAPVGNAVVQRKVESSCSILNIMWLKRMGSAFHVAEQGEGPVVLVLSRLSRELALVASPAFGACRGRSSRGGSIAEPHGPPTLYCPGEGICIDAKCLICEASKEPISDGARAHAQVID
jgi:hypothetical protein